LHALDSGDTDRYEKILPPTVPLGRHIFVVEELRRYVAGEPQEHEINRDRAALMAWHNWTEVGGAMNEGRSLYGRSV
jgi:hypothetical protein